MNSCVYFEIQLQWSPTWKDIQYFPRPSLQRCTLWSTNCSTELEIFSPPVCFHWPLGSCRVGVCVCYSVHHQCCQQFLGHNKCSICVCGMEWVKGALPDARHFHEMFDIYCQSNWSQGRAQGSWVFQFYLNKWEVCCGLIDKTAGSSILVFVPEPWLLPWLDLYLALHYIMLSVSPSWTFVSYLSYPHQTKSLCFTFILMSLN